MVGENFFRLFPKFSIMEIQEDQQCASRRYIWIQGYPAEMSAVLFKLTSDTVTNASATPVSVIVVWKMSSLSKKIQCCLLTHHPNRCFCLELSQVTEADTMLSSCSEYGRLKILRKICLAVELCRSPSRLIPYQAFTWSKPKFYWQSHT